MRCFKATAESALTDNNPGPNNMCKDLPDANRQRSDHYPGTQANTLVFPSPSKDQP